jgi:hypothetical protein
MIDGKVVVPWMPIAPNLMEGVMPKSVDIIFISIKIRLISGVA